jgi:predicted PurR-regulated permease PerM
VLILFPSILIALAVQDQIVSLLSPETITTVQNAVINLQQLFSERFGIDFFERVDVNEIYARFAVTVQNALTSFAPRVIISITGFLLSTFLVFFLLYYLLIHSGFVIETFRYYFPLSNRNIDLLLAEVASGTRSLILGQLLIALIQGGLGALGFLIFGIPGVFLWGFVMSVLSFIPFLGSFIIWVPAGIIMLAQGNYFAGLGILIWGFSLVSTIDNLIRPKLTSSLGRIHPVTVLLGVFIGLREWGVIGLVLGPLLITILMALIRMFREEYLVEKTAS